MQPPELSIQRRRGLGCDGWVKGTTCRVDKQRRGPSTPPHPGCATQEVRTGALLGREKEGSRGKMLGRGPLPGTAGCQGLRGDPARHTDRAGWRSPAVGSPTDMGQMLRCPLPHSPLCPGTELWPQGQGVGTSVGAFPGLPHPHSSLCVSRLRAKSGNLRTSSHLEQLLWFWFQQQPKERLLLGTRVLPGT